LVARWPTHAHRLLVECDAAGGDVAARFALPVHPGLDDLAAAADQARETDVATDSNLAWRHAQPLPVSLSSGLPVVVAPSHPDQASAACTPSPRPANSAPCWPRAEPTSLAWASPVPAIAVSVIRSHLRIEALYVMNRDGSHQRRIASPELGVAHPDWSPDGRWITFTTEPGGPESILAVRPDGTGLHSLRPATSRLQFYKAAFSPDGHNILVGCNDLVTHVDKICRMTADSNNVRVIVDTTPYDVNYPAWGP